MTMSAAAGFVCALAFGGALGCSSQSVEAGTPAADGNSLQLSVGPDGRTFVELSTPSVLSDVEGTGRESIAWDLALQGRDVFTNGGISGPGNSSAFGPLSSPTYLSDTAPDVPLMLKDRAGGALIDWYKYAGSTHELFSRYHVYGIQDGSRFYKLQILGYYGERLGAPVAALYRVRYAEVTAEGVGQTHDVVDIDGTAGGSKDDDKQPSGCLDLDSEQVTPLTPAEAEASAGWQLCFRREAIAVSGGLSGPRDMKATDLQAADTSDETEMQIMARTSESEQQLFDDVDYARLTDPALAYRSDGVVTAFAQRWLDPGSDPLALSDSVWLVIGADGASKYLMEFSDLSGDPAAMPATLRLHAKRVK